MPRSSKSPQASRKSSPISPSALASGNETVTSNDQADQFAMGFVCKQCGRFFDHSKVEEWETSSETIQGESWLKELKLRCPLCGTMHTYTPNESTLRGLIDQ